MQTSYNMYNSEAQAYQAWRRNIKLRIRKEQRDLSYVQYEGAHQTKHPAILAWLTALMGRPINNMPIQRVEDCNEAMQQKSRTISSLQNTLNKYKVRHGDA